MPMCEQCRQALAPSASWGPWRARGAYSVRPVVFYEGHQVPVTRRAARLLALLIRQRGSVEIAQVEEMAAAREDTTADVARPLAYRVRKLVAEVTGGAWRVSQAQHGVYRLEAVPGDP